MRSATPHIGVERSVGPKTVVLSFPRVEVECLLALAERARGGADAVEGMNFLSPHIKGPRHGRRLQLTNTLLESGDAAQSFLHGLAAARLQAPQLFVLRAQRPDLVVVLHRGPGTIAAHVEPPSAG